MSNDEFEQDCQETDRVAEAVANGELVLLTCLRHNSIELSETVHCVLSFGLDVRHHHGVHDDDRHAGCRD